MTPHPNPTTPEAPATAGAFVCPKEDAVMQESAKFQAWQSVDCAWCDNKAKGNELYVYDGQWFASCGKHGRKFENFKEQS